jgi:hypothetical protein
MEFCLCTNWKRCNHRGGKVLWLHFLTNWSSNCCPNAEANFQNESYFFKIMLHLTRWPFRTRNWHTFTFKFWNTGLLILFFLDGLKELEQWSHKSAVRAEGMCRVNTFVQSCSLFFLYKAKDFSPPRIAEENNICQLLMNIQKVKCSQCFH